MPYKKSYKGKFILWVLTTLVYLAVFSIPALVILGVWNLSASTVSWILIILVAMIGAERLFTLFKNNNLWSVKLIH
jgi:hypothetical protein